MLYYNSLINTILIQLVVKLREDYALNSVMVCNDGKCDSLCKLN